MTSPLEQEQLIAKLESDPVYFIEIFLERDLSAKQKMFIEATKTRKHVVAIWSRQTGKSTVIASYILWRLLYGKGIDVHGERLNEQIAIAAPIKEQLTNLYEKIRTLVDRNPLISGFIVKMNSERIIMKNGNFAKFMSANPGSHIRGFTATCIVIDESQDITDHKYTADLLPFGATTNALIIEAGTPKTKNHFFDVINSKSVAVIKQPWFECPFLSEDYVMAQREISPEALWRQEYLCEFIEEGVLAFPSWLFEPGKNGLWNLAEYSYITQIDQLTKNKVVEVQNLIKEGATFCAGLDLGKQNDNSVYTIVRTDIRPVRIEVKIKFALKTPYMEVAKVIGMYHHVYSPYEFNVDYSNEKTFIELLQENNVAVVKDAKMKRGAIAFNNKNKAEMINNARILLEQYQLQLPRDAEDLISEFMNQQYEINGMQNYVYFHPTNQNDDSLWSLLLAIKNLTTMSNDDMIAFKNPWEKFDENVRGGIQQKEIAVTIKKHRDYRGRYIPADKRRNKWMS